MKTLENQTLLYDEDCPLCSVYTTGFIKNGMLDVNGRKLDVKIASPKENRPEKKPFEKKPFENKPFDKTSGNSSFKKPFNPNYKKEN